MEKYIKPEMEIVEFDTEDIITGSTGEGNVPDRPVNSDIDDPFQNV